MKATDFIEKKRRGEKVSFITAYDFSMAEVASHSQVDAILVGDSVAMVVHGFPSTIHATAEMMLSHTAAVRRGAPDTFVVSDMPFLTFRKGVNEALDVAGRLMQAGAWAVKVEGVRGHEEVIARLVESGIPVMGHLGLVPQSVHQLGGYKVQGKEAHEREEIAAQARLLQELGAFSLVLECVPTSLAGEISRELEIPTIGIGAGAETDGQVLVWHDLLGLSSGPLPKFVRTYHTGREQILGALNRFHSDVTSGTFPDKRESYGVKEGG